MVCVCGGGRSKRRNLCSEDPGLVSAVPGFSGSRFGVLGLVLEVPGFWGIALVILGFGCGGVAKTPLRGVPKLIVPVPGRGGQEGVPGEAARRGRRKRAPSKRGYQERVRREGVEEWYRKRVLKRVPRGGAERGCRKMLPGRERECRAGRQETERAQRC